MIQSVWTVVASSVNYMYSMFSKNNNRSVSSSIHYYDICINDYNYNDVNDDDCIRICHCRSTNCNRFKTNINNDLDIRN